MPFEEFQLHRHFMNRLIRLLLPLFLTVFPLFSEEFKEVKLLPKSNEDYETRVTQANFSGVPNAFVGGMVNAVTGDLALYEVDLVIPGPTPITFERSYSSSFNKNGTLELGWNLNHLTRIKKQQGNAVTLNEGQGALTVFQRRQENDEKFYVSKQSIDQGMTNCGKGEISGRTNTKNTYLTRSKLKEGGIRHYRLYDGSGLHHLYKKLDHSHNINYLLKRTTFPNGNLLYYDYNKDHEIAYCSLKSGTQHLTGFGFTYEKYDIHCRTNVNLDDGRHIHYLFYKINGEWCLKKVDRPDGLSLHYEYQNGKYDRFPRISRRWLSFTRYTDIHYWMKNDPVSDGKVLKSHDRQRFRVKSLAEPVGADDQPIQTYRFQYYLNAENLGGRTEVFDVNSSKTIYYYNEFQRLTALDYYGDRSDPYRKERLYWGKDADAGNVIAQTISGPENAFSIIHSFNYDSAGNPIEEAFHGNLTGKNTISPNIGSDGKTIKNGCESHTIYRTFSNDRFNLKLSETEGPQKNVYIYYKDKDLLKTKFSYDNSTLKSRNFYEYNSRGFLTREIIDDATTDTKNDLTNATQRIIREFSERTQAPFGLTEEEKLIYTDPNGNEICVKRIRNLHNSIGKLYEQHHYDIGDNLRYRLHWEYDARGNIIRAVNANGEETLRQYDELNQLVYEQGPNKAFHVEYSYDCVGRLTSATTVDHSTNQRYIIRHQYDKRGNRISSTDWYGNQTHYEYDRFDRLVKTTHPSIPSANGQLFRPEERIEYNALGHITKITNGNGYSIDQKNTIRGKPFEINYPDGSSERMTYNLDGTLQETIDKNGMTTRYSHDYQKRPIQIEYIASTGESLGIHTKEYSAFHLIREIDAEGHVTSYEYDRLGRPKAVIKADAAIYNTYDALGRKDTVKTFYGDTSGDYTLEVFEYDSKDRIVAERTEDDQGNILRKQTYVYDASGNKLQVSTYSDAGVGTTYFTYDFNNQPTKIVDPDNNITLINYRYDYRDAYNMVVPYSESIDPQGNVTISIGNARGKTAKIQKKNGMGQVIQERDFFYDGAGQLIQTQEKVFKLDAYDRQVVTQWTYDPIGQMTSCIEAVGTPEQKTTCHAYNNCSQKVVTYKPDGNQIAYAYDAKGRLATVTSTDQTISYAYTYNLNDIPILVEDLIHQTQSQKTYDSNNNLIEEILGNGIKLSYAYDRQGRLLATTLPDQSSIVYMYNAVDLLAVKRLSSSGEKQYEQTYQYDLGGNLREKQLPFNLGTVTQSYDLLNRHRSIQSSYFSELDVQYDSVGNLTSQLFKDPIGETPCKYSYDHLYQLSREDSVSSHTYQHDSLLNRFTKDEQIFDYNSLNQLLGDKLGAYTYDRNGNLAEKYDQKYAYDAWDRLISVTTENNRFTYVYDDLNRRLCKEAARWDPFTNEWTAEEKQYFLYQGENEIGSCDADYNMQELRVLGSGRGAEIGASIALEIGGETYIPLCNFAGNTQVLLNTSGEPVDIYRYTAFGEEVTLDASGATKNPTTAWRFSSKRYDPETGFIYFGRRYYDPKIARWITADPLSFDAGPNLYAYVNNSPLTHIDLYGLWGFDWADDRHERKTRDRITTNVTNYSKSRERSEEQVVAHSKGGISAFETLFPSSEPVQNYDLTDRVNPDTSHVAICCMFGVNTTLANAKENLGHIGKGDNTEKFSGLHNPTRGLLLDGVEYLLGLGGYKTEPVQALHNRWNAYFAIAKQDEFFLMIGHSQGVLHIRNGLNTYNKILRQRIYVVGIAPGAYVDPNTCAKVVHYRVPSYRDGVPRVDILGAIRAKDTIVDIQSHPDAAFFDHSFRSPSYKKVLKHHVATFINSGYKDI